MVTFAIVTTNHRESAEAIVAKNFGKLKGAKGQTVNQLEYYPIESNDNNTCREEYRKY